MDLAYRLLRSGLRCSYAYDSHMQAIHAALLAPDDVALGISHSGESQDTLDCLELAGQSGASTVGITSFSQSRLVQLCDLYLMTSTKKNYWMSEAIPSRIAQLALCDALCVAITRQKGASHQAVADRIDAAVERKRS
jgi:DNA-binding MurR/RpiR family transcriptional regulator